jgi:AraC family transcriptional regulator
MNSSALADVTSEPAVESLPAAISSLIDGAVATFEADRATSRRYLLRASAILRARKAAEHSPDVAREDLARGGLAAWQVNRVVDYIEQHLSDKITGRQLAGLVDISVGQLFRAFKASVGVPPFHYISSRRIQVACTLLKTSGESLSQIAFASGLCDQSHFCRVFRRAMGITPAAWRRANNEGPELGLQTRARRATQVISERGRPLSRNLLPSPNVTAR